MKENVYSTSMVPHLTVIHVLYYSASDCDICLRLYLYGMHLYMDSQYQCFGQ